MKPEKVAVVARRTRFEPTGTSPLAMNPASPMVLQGLMQILADLNRKVDALATRPRQEVPAAPAQPNAESPVESKAAEQTTALAKAPTPKINRSRLLNFFD